MANLASPPQKLWDRRDSAAVTIARNICTRYLVIGIDTLIGLVVMPFNVRHLGQSAWGLWLLTSSLSGYFTLLDLGYGSSLTRFVAKYRALEDARGINEVTSTLFVIFSMMGLVIYAAFAIVSANVQHFFNLTPDQVETARTLLLINGLQVALAMPFGVFGGVVNGFQRYDINNVVAIGTSLTAAALNVAMLMAGYSLVQLALATTLVRLASQFIYARNAYKVFPALSVRPTLFRRERLREVTGYSIYATVINWANRLNYMSDTLIIGAYMTPAAVALWAVPRRLGQAVRSLTNQFNNVLLPIVVDSHTLGHDGRLRMIFIHGTRLSLFGVVPLSAAMYLLADPLIPRYVGSAFAQSVPIAQILAWVIAFRVGNATAGAVLKGADRHKMLAFTNMGIAIVNIVLSVIWIQKYGLIGQAFGTLVPVAGASMFVLWPSACRRCKMTVFQAFREAVWPTLWPVAVMMVPVIALKAYMPATILSVLIIGTIGTLCYMATFVMFAIDRGERMKYKSKILQVAKWRPTSSPAAAAA